MASPHSRRFVLRLLAGAAGLLPHAARPQEGPRDQGIGGTGARPEPAPPGPLPGGGDRGIGGTGVIGTIRRFGSIIVNDLRIAYPAEVAVRIDGEPAPASALKIGQVVHVVAHPDGGGLATGRIDVASEVVGRIEAVAPGRLVVLGQRVATAGLVGEWMPGTRVAVSGLRRPDGVIVASLIEPRETGPDRVAGPVRRGSDGAPAIGNLRLQGAEALPLGQRALVTGEAASGTLRVTNAAATGVPFPPGLRQVSIEAYIGRSGTGLAVGSGFAVTGRAGTAVPRQGSVRAVLTGSLASDGALTVQRLRAEDRIVPPDSQGPRDFDRDLPRLDWQQDRLEPRGLPDNGPGHFGSGPENRVGGPSINTRPGAGDIRMPGDLGGPRGGEFTPDGAAGLRSRAPGLPPGGGLPPGPGPGGPGGFGGMGPPGNAPGYRR